MMHHGHEDLKKNFFVSNLGVVCKFIRVSHYEKENNKFLFSLKVNNIDNNDSKCDDI